MHSETHLRSFHFGQWPDKVHLGPFWPIQSTAEITFVTNLEIDRGPSEPFASRTILPTPAHRYERVVPSEW